MARLVPLVDLRTALRYATDTTSELQRFPDVEMNSYINRGIAQLHVKLIAQRGQGFQEQTTTVTTVANQELYSLPATFLEVVKVFMQDSNGGECVFHTYEENETDGMHDAAGMSYNAPGARRFYRLFGDSLSLRPRPNAVYTISLKYIPSAVILSSDGSTLDGIDGFEEYALGYAAQLVSMKQGDDQRASMADKQMGQALQNILAIQRLRNAGDPPRMTDVRGDKWWLGGRRSPGRRGRGWL